MHDTIVTTDRDGFAIRSERQTTHIPFECHPLRQTARSEIPEGYAFAGHGGERSAIRRGRKLPTPTFVTKAHSAEPSDGVRRQRITVSVHARLIGGRRLLGAGSFRCFP
jgi:hypothetical protein